MKKKKHPGGRPTIMTKELVNKLEEIFAIGGTDEEACFFADISKQTLYNYQEKHPEFVDRKESLKENPILLARRTVVDSLSNPQHAQWFLERKKKNEFSQRKELTGKDGERLTLNVISYADNNDSTSVQTQTVSIGSPEGQTEI